MYKFIVVLFIAVFVVTGCKKEPVGIHTEITSEIPSGEKIIVNIDDNYSWSFTKSPYKSRSSLPRNITYKLKAYYSDPQHSKIPITITITDTNGVVIDTKTGNGSVEYSFGI